LLHDACAFCRNCGARKSNPSEVALTNEIVASQSRLSTSRMSITRYSTVSARYSTISEDWRPSVPFVVDVETLKEINERLALP